jgi:hypothetical protein
MAAQRALADEAFKAQTKADLDKQDDTLAEHGRKLDAILAPDAREAEQRQKFLEQQRAAAGHRDTVRRISSSARRTIPRAHRRQPHLFPGELTVAGCAAVRGNALAEALAGTMRLPDLEEERQGIYRVTPPAGGQRRMATTALVLAWA